MNTKEIKDIYNNNVKKKFDSNYEYHRWFKTSILKSGYDMTKDAIQRHSKNFRINSYLELGPGAGTWTKLFIKKNPNAEFDLVDISSEMLLIAQKEIGKKQNIQYFESDFLEFNSNKKYDAFVSIRAIEYFSEKDFVIKKVFSLLNSNGHGLIITKVPKDFRNKILGRKINNLHKDMISPCLLRDLLQKHGFRDIKMYPATISFPIFKICFLNYMLYSIFKWLPLNFISQLFSESYITTFRKL